MEDPSAINHLHVIEHPEDAIVESLRLLKDGGRLVVISFASEGMTSWEKVKMDFRFLRALGTTAAPKCFASRSREPHMPAAACNAGPYLVETRTPVES